MSNPFPQIVNTVGTLPAGHIVLATEWNTEIGGIYTYINSTILASGLNKMSAKGDLYVFDGTALQAQAVGSDGQVLSADSTQPSGLAWASDVDSTLLTTKGDLLIYGASGAKRLPIGADKTVLTADSTLTDGVGWEAPPAVPLGGIILWDLSKRAMPSGYNLCDGGTYNGYVTPNTQGLYMAGAGLSNHGPAASGMGVIACGTIAGDASAGAGQGPQHAHGLGYSPGSVGGGAPTATSTQYVIVTPRYIALAYIMRTS